MAKNKSKEDEFIETWAVTRKKGFLKYVIVQGGISWGLFTGVIYIVLLSVIGLFTTLPGKGTLVMNKGFQLTLFFIFGIIMGIILWFKNEKKYLERRPYDK